MADAGLTLSRTIPVSAFAIFSGDSRNPSEYPQSYLPASFRFEAALKTKAAFPHLSWTMVAHDFGYHDQMHMIHDFQHLSGETPTGILRAGGSCFCIRRSNPGAQDVPETVASVGSAANFGAFLLVRRSFGPFILSLTHPQGG
jgi:hypothetical protein